MVQCHACKAILAGHWSVDTAGYQDGAYLGVQAFFAFHSTKWVYCFCTSCYDNGNFGKYISECYAQPLSHLSSDPKLRQMAQEMDNLRLEINELYQEKSIHEKQIQMLKKQNKNCQQIYPQQYIEMIAKMQQYQSELKQVQLQNFQDFVGFRQQIIRHNIQHLQKKTDKLLTNTIQKLNKIYKNYQTDINKIQKLKQLNISFMKQQISEANHKKLFLQNQIQNSEQLFRNKLQMQKLGMSKIVNLIQMAQNIKKINQNLYTGNKMGENDKIQKVQQTMLESGQFVNEKDYTTEQQLIKKYPNVQNSHLI